MLSEDLLPWFRKLNPKAGETIQYGWFIFETRIVDNKPVPFSLDFIEMASFTSDLSIADLHHHNQEKALIEHNLSEEPCSLWQTAVVSKSVNADSSPFIKRDLPEKSINKNDSGWYLGNQYEELDINEPNNLELKSLYEISLMFPHFIPYWLFPFNTTVLLTNGQCIVNPSQPA